MPERSCSVCQAPLPPGQDSCGNCAPPTAPPPAAAPGLGASVATWWLRNWLSALVLTLLASATVCLLLSVDVTATRRILIESLNRLVGAASGRTGAGVQASVLDLLVLDWLRDGQTDIEDLLRLISPAPVDAHTVRDALNHSLHRRMPILHRAGVY